MNYRIDLNEQGQDSPQVPPPADLQFRDEEDPKAGTKTKNTDRVCLTCRIDASKDEWNSVINLVSAKKWSEVKAFDQLVREMKDGKILLGFREGEYNFLPTFKGKWYRSSSCLSDFSSRVI